MYMVGRSLHVPLSVRSVRLRQQFIPKCSWLQTTKIYLSFKLMSIVRWLQFYPILSSFGDQGWWRSSVRDTMFHGRRRGKMVEACNGSPSIWGEMTCAISTHVFLTKASVKDTGKINRLRGMGPVERGSGYFDQNIICCNGSNIL